MKVYLFQNKEFQLKFEKLNPNNEKNDYSGNNIKKGTVELQIPPLSELTKQLGASFDKSEAENGFLKLFTKALEEEGGQKNVLKASITTIFDDAVEVQLEGTFLHFLFNLSEESLRIDVRVEIENGKIDEDAERVTLNYPDIPMSFDNQSNIVLLGKLRQKSQSKHKFHEEISYQGRISISLQLQSDVAPVEIKVISSATTKKMFHTEAVEYDFELISENGKAFPCHRRFLAGNSSVLARMFQSDWKDSKEKACNTNLTEKGLKALLKFIYEANIDGPLGSSRLTFELMETAHHSQYDIPLLEKAMKKLLLKQSSLWYAIDVALRLYRFSIKVDGCGDLKWKALKVINTKLDDLIGAREFENLLNEDRVAAVELMAYLKCI
ncbi:unnamed protein product [Orchesella dallaii]|uniref:BTB domain-containing protein n=1 Tax=Orchesella dallaii TaxID=48710 RepID=A0ABP1RPG1_9HEXA